MPVTTSLADASNGLLLSAVVLYALAMLFYACDLAFARHRVLAGVAEAAVTQTAAVPELVGAGAPAAGAAAPVLTGSVTDGPPAAGTGGAGAGTAAGRPVCGFAWPSASCASASVRRSRPC